MGLKQVDRLGLRSVVLTAAEDYPGTWLPWSIYALTSFYAVRQLHVTRAFQIRPSLLWYSDSLTHFYPNQPQVKDFISRQRPYNTHLHQRPANRKSLVSYQQTKFKMGKVHGSLARAGMLPRLIE